MNNSNNIQDFELYDYIADANFDHFIDLVRRSETEEDQLILSIAAPAADDLIAGSFPRNLNNQSET